MCYGTGVSVVATDIWQCGEYKQAQCWANTSDQEGMVFCGTAKRQAKTLRKSRALLGRSQSCPNWLDLCCIGTVSSWYMLVLLHCLRQRVAFLRQHTCSVQTPEPGHSLLIDDLIQGPNAQWRSTQIIYLCTGKRSNTGQGEVSGA